MKVAFFGYRDWALEIFSNLLETTYPFVDVDEADIVLYYGWSRMIPKKIYEKKLCLILHPSPLPKYRGGSPIQHQIIRGETKSAVTICQVTDKLDAGQIFTQTPFSLEGSLEDIFARIVEIGTKDTIKILNDYDNHTLKSYKQKGKTTTFRRRTPDESEIFGCLNQHWSAKQLYDFIRALNDPYPHAFIRCADGKKLYITGVHL